LSTFLILLIGTWEVGKTFANKRFQDFLEFQNLVGLHALAKHVLIEYKNLMVKMHDDLVGNAIANLTTMSCYVTMRLSWC
jgi:hypothetical protein